MGFCVRWICLWLVLCPMMGQAASGLMCGGDSLNREVFVDAVESLVETGGLDVEPFESVYLNEAMRPPKVLPGYLERIDPEFPEFSRLEALLLHSREQGITAIPMAQGNPEHLKRYRDNCLFDERSDTEILRQGVEVAQLVIAMSDGTLHHSPLTTSFKPAFLGIEDLMSEAMKDFVRDVYNQRPEGVSMTEMTIVHNHPRVDGLSPNDVSVAFLFSKAFQVRARIAVVVQVSGGIVTMTSEDYCGGDVCN